MSVLAGLLLLAQAADPKEEILSVTLKFESIHCADCDTELGAMLKRMPGHVSHLASLGVSGAEVFVIFKEEAPVPAFDRLPKDLKLTSISVTLRGTVSFPSEGKAVVAAKGSGQALALLNPEGKKESDRLSELRKSLGGKNRFRITGTLSDRSLVLQSFAPADWEDR